MAYIKEETLDINIKKNQINEIATYKEDDIFSNTTLSDVDDSYVFWRNDVDECQIFELCNEIESSEDENEKKDIKENVNESKLYCNVEINTLPMEITTTIIGKNNLPTETEKKTTN